MSYLLLTKLYLSEIIPIIKNIALPIGYLSTMEDPEYVETWIRCFEASVRIKNLKDTNGRGGKNEVTTLFLASAECAAIKTSVIAYPKVLKYLAYEEIATISNANVRPKKKVWS